MNENVIPIYLWRKDAEAFQDPEGNWVNGSIERLASACKIALKEAK